VTVTVTVAVADPPAPVAVAVKVVVAGGETVSEPEVGNVPLPPGVIATEVALVLFQVSVADWPAEIVVGEAVNCTVTALGAAGWLGGGAAAPVPPQAANRIRERITTRKEANRPEPQACPT
jgi:hypothetical protein